MKISIIIPVHNGENYIERCVNSITSQNFDNYEIILIENNSNDNTYNKCISLAENNKHIIFISTKEKGVSCARNIGLEYATGDVISFCDADDYLEPETFKNVRDIILRTDADVLVTGFNRGGAGNVFEPVSYPRDITVSAEKLIAMVINDKKIMGSVWNKYYKRDVVKDIEFDTSLTHCEDMYFNICVLSKSNQCKCMISNLITYNYFYNELSATNDMNKIYDDAYRLKYNNTFYKAIEQIELSPQSIYELRFAIFSLSLGEYCRLMNDENEEAKEKIKILRMNMSDCKDGYIRCLPRYFTKTQIKLWIKYCFRRLVGVR